MERIRQMVLGVVLAMMIATAGTAQADEVPVPAQAITDEVPVVVWIDLEGVSVDSVRASVQRIAELLPESMAEAREPMKAQAEQGMAEFGPALQAMQETGVRGLLFVMPGLPDDNGMGNDEPMALLHTNPGVTPDEVNATMREVAPQQEDVAEVVPYADGWLRIAEPNTPNIEDGDEANATAFRELLAASGDAPIRVALRITDGMKQQIAQQGQADPMMAGFANSLEAMETGWTTIEFGDQPKIANRMNFDSPEAAAEFNATWEGLLMMGEGMVMGHLGQLPDAPAPESVQALFESLQMEQDGASLSLELGEQFIGQAAEFAPAAMGMVMMMMMGGADFGPIQDDEWDAPQDQQPMF